MSISAEFSGALCLHTPNNESMQLTHLDTIQNPLPETRWQTCIKQIRLKTNRLVYQTITDEFLRSYLYRFWTLNGLLDVKILGAGNQREVLIIWSWESEVALNNATRGNIWEQFYSELTERCEKGQITIREEFENTFEIIE